MNRKGKGVEIHIVINHPISGVFDRLLEYKQGQSYTTASPARFLGLEDVCQLRTQTERLFVPMIVDV